MNRLVALVNRVAFIVLLALVFFQAAFTLSNFYDNDGLMQNITIVTLLVLIATTVIEGKGDSNVSKAKR